MLSTLIRHSTAATACLTGLALATHCQAAADHEHAPPASDINVQAVQAFTNLDFQRPLYIIDHPADSSMLFVVEQGGRIFLFPDDDDVTQDEVHTVLDIFDVTRSPINRNNRGHNEEGMYQLAFDPDFLDNRHVYLHYAMSNPRRGRISRFTFDDELRTLNPDSELIIYEIEQPAGNHNGGGIQFGHDGMFYIGIGDGGGAGDPFNVGQDLSSSLGTIIRIDVSNASESNPYEIPSDNPFIDHDEAAPEIWAWGLRNPWRFSFDRETGTLWMGDVCQNAWEKIYVGVAGANYGWPYNEGSHPYDGIPDHVDPNTIEPPIAEHPHPVTRSITGGYVYRGQAIPDLQGTFVYGDYVTGLVIELHHDEQTGQTRAPRLLDIQVPEIASFGQMQDGELFIVSLAGGIYRLQNGD